MDINNISILNDSTMGKGHPLLTTLDYSGLVTEECFHELRSRSYFVPPVYFSQEKFTKKNIDGKSVNEQEYTQLNLMLKKVQVLQNQVLTCLHAMANKLPNVVIVFVSQLQFNNYLVEPTTEPAAALLPRPSTLPKEFKQGDFNILIKRKLGLSTLEIRSMGKYFTQQTMTEQMIADLIEKVNEANQQLKKARVLLKHLTSDLETEINITKCLVMPTIMSGQVKRALERNPSTGQFQAQKMQKIHVWDDLYFSNPVIPLTPCTIPSIVKDGSTIQYREQTERSQMVCRTYIMFKVTDTPEVLDTHLKKEDVNSKVPQKNWREGIFNLRWKHLSVHQVIVVFILFTISFTQGISSQCETSLSMNCTQLFLTCSFDTDIIQLARNLYINHMENNSIDLEIILACQRSSDGFHCETIPTYEFVSVESNRLTIMIPEINLKHAGTYWCDVQGFVNIDRTFCELSLPDTSSVVSEFSKQENGPSCKVADDHSSPATIANVVLGISLVLVGIILLFILLYIFWKRQMHYATRSHHENCKAGMSAPTANAKEECELL